MAVIVTRPQPEAATWVDLLRAEGVDASALPLLEIGSPHDELRLREAWQQLAAYRAVMFVSGNAVRKFFAQQPPERQWPEGVSAWAPGPGTSDMLRAAGVPGGCIEGPASDAAQFDSEALWAQVQSMVRAGDRVLIVRGGDALAKPAGREWLGQQLVLAGAQVDTVVAYVRRAPVWNKAQQEEADQAARDGSLWLFSSSEAIGNLQRLLPGQDWSHACAMATHPRIAQAARAAGFGTVHECRPSLDAVVTSIKSTR